MAEIDPEKEIVKKCNALISAVNTGMEAFYKKNGKKDPKAKVEKISLHMSNNKATQTRTPEEQAEQVLSGKSWTCNSSHMTEAARDLYVKLGKSMVKNLSTLAKDEKEAYDEFVKLFDTHMQKQDLRNFKKGTGFLPKSNDPLHVELPDSRLKDTDPPVIKCLEYYANATRKGNRKKNEAFEKTKGSDSQRKWLQDYDKKNPGPGATIQGIVYSYTPALHDAVGAIVTLSNTKSNFKKVATANQKLSQLAGHKSCYVMTGVPDAESGTYVMTATYKNLQTGKAEKTDKATIHGPVKPGSTVTVNMHMKK